MVQAITGIKPYVSAVPPVTQQQRVNQIKLERNEVTDDLRNGKITDLQAMSERVALDSKMSDAKAQSKGSFSTPVEAPRVSKTNTVTKPHELQPANMRAVDKQQKGKELSPAEKQKMVDNQMKQMAINNQVLHGLVAV